MSAGTTSKPCPGCRMTVERPLRAVCPSCTRLLAYARQTLKPGEQAVALLKALYDSAPLRAALKANPTNAPSFHRRIRAILVAVGVLGIGALLASDDCDDDEALTRKETGQ